MAEPLTAYAAPFSQNRRAKIKNLLLVFGLALICFVPLWGFILFEPRVIFYFPVGLFLLLSDIGLVHYAGGDEPLFQVVALFIWLLLLGISATIVMSNKSAVVRGLFIVAIILLILNMVGWYYQVISRIT